MGRIADRILKFCESIDVGYHGNRFFRRARAAVALLPTNQKSAARYFAAHTAKIGIEQNLILFESFWGRKIACNPLAVFLEMQSAGELVDKHVIWVRNAGVPLPFEISKVPHLSFVEFNSLEYADALMRAKVLVNNSTFPVYFWRKPQQVYINTWHGIPLKKMGRDADPAFVASMNTQRNFLQSTHIVVAGEFAADKIVRPYGMYSATSEKVRFTGSPRVDLTLRSDRLVVRARLGLADSKPLIVFAPTWRGKVGQIKKDIQLQLDAVNELVKQFGESHHILLSVHNYVASKLPNMPESVMLVPAHVDINQILAATDVLITDYSSIFIDYLVLDRPVILYVPDRAEYEAERGVYTALETLPVTLANTLEELQRAVRKGARPSDFPTHQVVLKTFLPYEDGQASRRVADIVMRELSGAGHLSAPRKKQRLVFYPGALSLNGITTSFLSLVASIDKSRFDIATIVLARNVDKSPALKRIVATLSEHSELLPVSSTPPAGWRTYLSTLAAVQNNFLWPFRAKDQQWRDDYFRGEAMRIFGTGNFDVAIDYSGYAPRWTNQIAQADCSRHVIYQHNDLLAEWANPDKLRDQSQLASVFQCYNKFDAIISVSEPLQKVNQKSLGQFYGSAQSDYVDNIIDLARVRRLAASPINWSEFGALQDLWRKSKFRFLSIGRLSPEKNHTRLLQAFARLDPAKGACLVIMGDGPLRGTLLTESERLGISSRVHFTGLVHNPLRFTKLADCNILASDYEGQPTVILEALALGKLMIATASPGSASILSKGQGLLVECSVEGVHKGMVEAIECRIKCSPPDMETRNEKAIRMFYEKVCGLESDQRGGAGG